MVQILPQTPSLVELLGSGIGQGVNTAMHQKMQLNQALALEKQKQQLKQQGLQQILSGLGLTSQPTAEVQPGISQQMQSQGQISSQNQQMSQLEKIATNPQAMAALSAVQPQMANQIQQMYGNLLRQKKFEATQASSESKKYKERIEDIQSSLPDKRMALYRISDALKSNDLKSLRNFYADYLEAKGLPGEFVRNSSGTVLQSATKEFLMGDIARIKGGRPNQFIEKQLSSAYPKAGYDKMANDKIVKAMQTGVEIIEKESEIFEKLSDTFEKQGKPVPGNISKLVNKELKPFVLQKEKELQDYYQSLNKEKKTTAKTEYFNINGTEYNIPKHLVPAFKKDMGIEND